MEENTVPIDDIKVEDFAADLKEVFDVQRAIDEARLFIHGIENAGEDVTVRKRGKNYVIVWDTGTEELWFDFLSLDLLFVKEEKEVFVVEVDEGGVRRICGMFHSLLDAKNEAQKLAKSYEANMITEDRWIGENISVNILKEKVI